jgi:hypothetical protein
VTRDLEEVEEDELKELLDRLHAPPDPIARNHPGHWHATRKSILDGLPQVGVVVVPQNRELSSEERQQELFHYRISKVVLRGLLFLMAALIVRMALPVFLAN